jgi:multidrug efflux pump subunit AcrB
VKSLEDVEAIPVRAPQTKRTARLDAMASIRSVRAPTEVDHYQLRRVVDVYVMPAGEDLGRIASSIDGILKETHLPDGVRVQMRGMVQGMRISFKSFGMGLILAVILVYLILVAQFQSWIDPLLILLAVPVGLTGVLIILLLTGTTLNVMSLMGIVMMVGIVVSNSILIVEFTHRLREDGKPLQEAVALACRVRLRPVLMTSLATLIGLIPMAAKLGTGSEAYAPLARAIIGGLAFSVVLTVYIVPAAYLLVYRRKERKNQPPSAGTATEPAVSPA